MNDAQIKEFMDDLWREYLGTLNGDMFKVQAVDDVGLAVRDVRKYNTIALLTNRQTSI